jgi:hypothetical protein
LTPMLLLPIFGALSLKNPIASLQFFDRLIASDDLRIVDLVWSDGPFFDLIDSQADTLTNDRRLPRLV